ncbi:MAG: hypothetical protein SPI12_07115 [Actinomycetaceae bacterium]|nr:hypothetical protein [Actinomycetaceae bacterium]MDY6083605.1 hypothetical protein [Actinomycetaceae bacterium]
MEPREPRYFLRATSAYIYAACAGVIAVTILGIQLFGAGGQHLFPTLAALCGLAGIVWVLALVPSCEVTPTVVVLHHSIWDTAVPMNLIESVDTRWGLQLLLSTGKKLSVPTFSQSGRSRQYKWTAGEIPLLHSGTIPLTTTTRAAAHLISRFLDQYADDDIHADTAVSSPHPTHTHTQPQPDEHAPLAPTRSINVLNFAIVIVSCALVIFGVASH